MSGTATSRPPPALVTITKDGQRRDVVAQIAKNGRTYVLDRETGEPIFPMRGAARAGVGRAGRVLAHHAALPLLPPPFARQQFTEDLSPSARRRPSRPCGRMWRKLRKARRVRPAEHPGHRSLPGHGRRRRVGRRGLRSGLGPALRQRERDGVAHEAGRAEDAGGQAHDRQDALPALLRVVPSRRPQGHARRSSRRSSASARAAASTTSPRSCAKAAAACRPSRHPRRGAPRDRGVRRERHVGDGATPTRPTPFDLRYSMDGYTRFTDPDGFPAITPPWGTLDRDRHEQGVDRVAGAARRDAGLGRRQLRQRELRRAGGHRERPPLHRRDRATTRSSAPSTPRTGKLLWETTLPAAGNATPAVYEVNGRQFVVIAAGGGKWGAPSGGSYVAFALPEARPIG